MVKTRHYNVTIGTRAAGTALHYISGMNVMDVTVLMVKLDQGTTGQIFAENYYLKEYAYDTNTVGVDAPSLYFPFAPPDGGAIAHERMSGATLTVGGTGAGVVPGTAGDTRYAGKFGMLTKDNSALQLTGAVGTSSTPMSTAEINGVSWSVDFWIFRAAAASGYVCLESNAGVTVFQGIFLDAAGHVQVLRETGAAYTSVGTVAVGTWTHVALAYSAGAATIQLFLNGAASGTAVAYTRSATRASTQNSLNAGPSGVNLVAHYSGYYGVALVAGDANRHWFDLAVPNNPGGFVSTPANVGYNTANSALFSNTVAPGYSTAAGYLTLPISPIMLIATTGGVYLLDVTIREYE